MNLLDKIKKEHESPTVKVVPRQDELLPKIESISAQTQEAFQTPQSSTTEESIRLLEQELATLPSITNKKIGVRLEEGIYEEIRKLCHDNNITVETLLEAYFTICNSQPDLESKIIENAQNRLKQRTKAGNIRSLITKTKNLTNQKS